MTTTINIDEALLKKAAEYYPSQTPEEVTQEALKSYLANEELLRMKGILTEDDLWPEYQRQQTGV